MATFNDHISIGDPAGIGPGVDEAIQEAAEKNPRVLAVLEDMGFPNILWWKKHADRLVECGISEQNGAVVAGALASEGFVPVVNSFMFANVGRAWNQIRQSVLVDRFNAKFIAREGVFHEFGVSHSTTEGIASCRVLPNLVLLNPADRMEARKATTAMMDYFGPVVLRVEMGPDPLQVFTEDYEFNIGKGYFVKNGKDATIIATGLMTSEAIKAIDILEKDKLDVGVLNMGTLKPIDQEAVIAAAKESGAIVTAEVASVIGGLGEAVASVVVQNYPVPMIIAGVEDEFTQSGGVALMRHFALTAEDLAVAVRNVVARKEAARS